MDTRQAPAQFLPTPVDDCPSPRDFYQQMTQATMTKATSLKMEMSRMNIWVKARTATQNSQGRMIPVWEL